tara:strand:- start:723 stop:1460 length:738 start_codon:yes stop_codon:yes gene_type:complete
MDFSFLPHDVMEHIWNMKVKEEKLDKAEASRNKNYKLVLKELRQRSYPIVSSAEEGSDDDELYLWSKYSEYMMGEEDDLVDEDGEPIQGLDLDEWTTLYKEENDFHWEKRCLSIIDAIILTDEYEGPDWEGSYHMCIVVRIMGTEILKEIKTLKEAQDKYIKRWKEDFLNYDNSLHYGARLDFIKQMGYEDAPLHMKWHHLRKTNEEGFGGRMEKSFEKAEENNNQLQNFLGPAFFLQSDSDEEP